MTNNMTMIMVNILDAKTRLSELLDQAARGERVVICKRNTPVAELHPVAAARTEPRPLGLAQGSFTIPAAFFDPLPDDMLLAFDGQSAGQASLPSRVAEPEAATYRVSEPKPPRKRSRR